MRFLIVGGGLSAALIAAVVHAVPARAADGLAGLHTKVVIGDKVCFKDHYHHGDSGAFATEAEAAAAAARAWGSFTALEYGEAWSDFRLAADRTMNCRSAAVQGGPPFICQAKALPCRFAAHAAPAGRRGPAHAAMPTPRHEPALPALGPQGQPGHRSLTWPGDAPSARPHW